MIDFAKSLLDLKSLTATNIHTLFEKAKKLKQKPGEFRACGETIALLFFEPSTRTRMSFETAAIRCGLGPVVMAGHSSSLEKGETIEDTILNAAAMQPRFLVIRVGDGVDLVEMSRQVSMPILSGGWGKRGHPTQGLLDVFTMQDRLGDLADKKILFVGDVKHSRVAISNFEVLSKLGAQVALCAPAEFMPDTRDFSGPTFKSLDEGLKWADAVVALRAQLERHFKISFSASEFREAYGLNKDRLKNFTKSGIILHPGPVTHGVELESEVFLDPRCVILEQVTNGVYIREAIMRIMMGE